jgi:thiol-disulfide isomerase/thioredoxin
MARKSEAIVFISVAMPCILGGFLILRQNQEIKQILAGQPKVINVGNQLGSLHGYNWNSHPATLVIALRAGCPFCRASMPLYGRIGDRWREGKLRAYPVVLFPDRAIEDRPELRGLQVLSAVDYLSIGILSTPTVLLVDSRGKVVHKWTGQLASPQEEVVLAETSASTRSFH